MFSLHHINSQGCKQHRWLQLTVVMLLLGRHGFQRRQAATASPTQRQIYSVEEWAPLSDRLPLGNLHALPSCWLVKRCIKEIEWKMFVLLSVTLYRRFHVMIFRWTLRRAQFLGSCFVSWALLSKRLAEMIQNLYDTSRFTSSDITDIQVYWQTN
jgi:hypothetical protein